MLQAVIASRLRDGRVVYLAPIGWSESLAEAELAASKEAAETLMTRAQAAIAVNEVVDAYLSDMVEEGGAIRPLSLRERIRSLGPTVRSDLGYQAGDP